MLAVSHATSGAALGLAVAGFAPRIADVAPSPGSVLTFAAVCAGAALLPDLDHPSSTATRRFSVFSWLACNAVRPLSGFVFDLTRGRRDHGKGTHRGLTHTAAGAVLLGLAVNLASAAWGTPVLLGTLFVCIALAIKGLDALVPGPPSLVIAAGLTWGVQEWVPGGTAGTAGWLGTAVALGMLVHAVGRRDHRERRPAAVAAAHPRAHLVPGGQPARRRGSAPAGRSSPGSWLRR